MYQLGKRLSVYLFSPVLQGVNPRGFLPSISSVTVCRRLASLTQQLFANPVGLSGLEPLTPALSAQCSNRLSYRPILPLSRGGYLRINLALA